MRRVTNSRAATEQHRDSAQRSSSSEASGYSSDDLLPSTGHSQKSEVHSDDGDFDMAYPSARALRVRTSLSRQIQVDDDNEEAEFALKGGSSRKNIDGSARPEDACYPKRRAFGTIRHHQGHEKLDNDSVGSSGDFFKEGIDFLKDPPEQMTIGRRIALRLQHKKWYNPRAGLQFKKYDDVEVAGEDNAPNLPSLQKAWAYFEHTVLTRYIVESHNTAVEGWWSIRKFIYSFKNFNEEFERAQPGENQRPTKLYDAITTPHVQLGDFGLGFGLYFSTLRAIGYILFVAGCISSFNIVYFASDEYSVPGSLSANPLLYGSAICMNTPWELCIDCNCTNTTQGWDRTNRCASAENGLTMIVKNNCLQDNGFRRLGLVNFASVIFLVLSIMALGVYLKRQTIQFDEDEQTAQDYSILISNPPPKANDPDVWRRFFETNFPGVKCAAVTCAVNNDLLVRALVARREVLRMMELQLDPGTAMDIDHLALLAAKAARKNKGVIKRIMAIFMPGLPELLSRLVALNTSIKGLAQLGYPCTNVFVTFEREADQREVLGKLSVGHWHIRQNNTKVLEAENYLFQGRLLHVSESVEPNSVRWQDLNATVAERTDQMLLTSIITFGSILAGAKAVQFADRIHPLGAAFCIAAFNLAFPELAKLIVNLESHPNESKLQMSLYWKIALFRWVNTAIVFTVITPFTHTLALEDGLIPQIYSIFFAEIVTTNVIQMADVWGHFQRHFLAPRASTQDTMNLCFQGLEVELAERYTNMTKIMFLAFWYCSIFPQALFLAAVALLVNYYTDRFSLMRTWKRAPRVSTEISHYSRLYFFSSACIFLAGMSSFYWSAYPFDNLCLVEDQTINETYVGSHTVSIADRFNTEIRVEQIVLEPNSKIYKFCEQDYILGSQGTRYPFFADEWMGENQRWVATLFAWTSVGVMSLVGAKFLVSGIYWVQSLFAGAYMEPGDDQGIKFHDVRNINAYIPQVRSSIFSYPLIACKCDKIGEQLFDWTDPDRDYTYYDLTKDADHILSGSNKRAKQSFSRVKHYPPNRVNTIKARKRFLEMRIAKSRNVFNSLAVIDTSNLSASLNSGSGRDKRASTVQNRTSSGDMKLLSAEDLREFKVLEEEETEQSTS